jgi:hypothetical protein
VFAYHSVHEWTPVGTLVGELKMSLAVGDFSFPISFIEANAIICCCPWPLVSTLYFLPRVSVSWKIEQKKTEKRQPKEGTVPKKEKGNQKAQHVGICYVVLHAGLYYVLLHGFKPMTTQRHFTN